MMLMTMMMLATGQAQADEGDNLFLHAELFREVTVLQIQRASVWLRVAAMDDTQLGAVLIDCVGNVDCRVSTEEIGELPVYNVDVIATRFGDGLELEVGIGRQTAWIEVAPAYSR